MRTRKDIRNIGIVAHVDHGKTTLVDAMLRQAGIFRDPSSAGERIMDSNPIERERGITILAKNTGIVWNDTKINIVDTPGHADFGGEVERVLQMVNGVLLLVDAAEGPLPQTRFVLRKALEQDLPVILVINKIDRKDARPREVLDEVLGLFIDIGCADHQLDFPVVYTNAREGLATFDPDQPGSDISVLMKTIIRYIPEPPGQDDAPFQMLVSNIDHNEYVGRIAVGRIFRGTIHKGDAVVRLQRNASTNHRVTALYDFYGLQRRELEEASAGDIIALAGIEAVNIAETIAAADQPEAVDAVLVDEPTVAIDFLVNKSPFAGREGKFVTSRHLKERLEKELLSNVALRVAPTPSPDTFTVSGRGELHLSVLIETMRREGYELAVSKPQVVVIQRDGKTLEPVEYLVVDVAEEYSGAVIEALGQRRAILLNVLNMGSQRRLECTIFTRALFGLRGELLTLSRGTAIMSHTYHDHQPPETIRIDRSFGALISAETGVTTPYALDNLQQRGRFFVGPQTAVYEGMVVGRANSEDDIAVNVCKLKKLTNMRASGSDDAPNLAPPEPLTLERALEFIKSDELIEVTPKSIRLRKQSLTEEARRKSRTAARQRSLA
ncbi:MAG: translational GTPase TypA [Candidatus Eremiobacter antarcticus]|nr:translational GTPase TypA [Candidatus Eremiobacteraeota bacterium]MBC5807852.1 translational GTPase TypA [Candidatus Eremiobacteraeota bacterium]PZR62775.1 MAG: translational GTPase TypA [Candidatus Eremiobacter sp. RRmetagenome_bin22]